LTSPLAILGPKVLGFDVSGTVEAVGSGCTRLKVGDAIWADLGKSGILKGGVQLGAWAQFAVADESQVGLKPHSLNFTEAATLPLVALTDYQALKKAGFPWTGKKNLTVVVTSGSGGTGVPAIQLVKACGASRIITAASPSHAALLKELGATDVFDYHKTTIWKELPEDSVDIVYDNYGSAGTADAAMPSLRSGGVFVFLPGKGGSISKHPKLGVKQINYGLCDSSKHEDLDALKAIADAGNLKAVVQETFALGDIVKALNASFAGHVVGKLAIDCAAGYDDNGTYSWVPDDDCKSPIKICYEGYHGDIVKVAKLDPVNLCRYGGHAKVKSGSCASFGFGAHITTPFGELIKDPIFRKTTIWVKSRENTPVVV